MQEMQKDKADELIERLAALDAQGEKPGIAAEMLAPDATLTPTLPPKEGEGEEHAGAMPVGEVQFGVLLDEKRGMVVLQVGKVKYGMTLEMAWSLATGLRKGANILGAKAFKAKKGRQR